MCKTLSSKTTLKYTKTKDSLLKYTRIKDSPIPPPSTIPTTPTPPQTEKYNTTESNKYRKQSKNQFKLWKTLPCYPTKPSWIHPRSLPHRPTLTSPKSSTRISWICSTGSVQPSNTASKVYNPNPSLSSDSPKHWKRRSNRISNISTSRYSCSSRRKRSRRASCRLCLWWSRRLYQSRGKVWTTHKSGSATKVWF